eukprot:872294-Prymnesium_polylepis.1
MRKARSKANAGDATDLDGLRSSIFEPSTHKNLRPADPAGGAPGAKAAEARTLGGKRVTAAPPAPPPDDPAEAERARRAACCVALAMGTHRRLGLQSRVHELRGRDDVFRLITEHAELRTSE